MKIRNEVLEAVGCFRNRFPVELFQNKDFYSNWLAQTYFFVRHSTPLLGYAMPFIKDEDLRRHFEHHLGEEEKHDMLALKDIQRLGYEINSFSENVMTQAFYQSQYYRITFQQGTALLGYILFLEAIAVDWGKDIYNKIQHDFKNSCLFIKVHAEEDPHHVEQAIGAIEKLSEVEQKYIMENFRYSFHVYSLILEEIRNNIAIKSAA